MICGGMRITVAAVLLLTFQALGAKKKKKKNKNKSKENGASKENGESKENVADSTDKSHDVCSEAGSDPISEGVDVVSGLSTPLSEVPPPSTLNCAEVQHQDTVAASENVVEVPAVARTSHAVSSNGDSVKRTPADAPASRPNSSSSKPTFFCSVIVKWYWLEKS
jgi:hypothetical protein